MDKRILVFDVDGTVAPYGEAVSVDVGQGLRALERQGHTVCFASGKPCGYLEGLIRGLGLRRVYAIGENGATLLGGYRQRTLPTTQRPQWFDAFQADIARLFPAAFFQNNLVNVTVFAEDAATLDGVAQYMRDNGYCSREDITAYIHEDAAEIVPAGVSKGSGLTIMKQRFGWQTQDIVAAGDGENDLSLRDAAGTFCAVGNKIEAKARFKSTDALIKHLLKTYA